MTASGLTPEQESRALALSLAQPLLANNGPADSSIDVWDLIRLASWIVSGRDPADLLDPGDPPPPPGTAIWSPNLLGTGEVDDEQS